MFRFSKQCISLIWDLIRPVDPQQILIGNRAFRPFLSYQKAWLAHFYPGDIIDHHNSWRYLHQYVLPFIKQYGSSYHLQGIQYLKLNTPQKPDFKEFQRLFKSIAKNFELISVTKEIEAREYFSLIRQKKFPCIKKVRTIEEIFCSNEPDFWHEAIGHIAPLCFPEIQSFYLEIADFILSAKSKSQFEKNLAVAWTITEYGFIKQNGQNKMFGAALVGSHLANMRYSKGLISIEPATKKAIIDSGFYDEHSPIARDSKGNFRFFYLKDLNIAKLFT